MSVMTPEVNQLGAATNARKWRLDVNVGTYAAPVWERLRGVSEFTPSSDPSTQDTTDYDSQGWKSSAVTALGWGVTITVERKVDDEVPTEYDAAQEFLRLKADQTGLGNVVDVRYYEWNGLEGPRVQAYRGKAGVQYAEQGGAPDAKSTAQITLTGQGTRAVIAHPLAAYGATAWTATTAYAVGALVTIGAGTVQATVAGTSGATAPGLPAANGLTVTDGSVTWVRIA